MNTPTQNAGFIRRLVANFLDTQLFWLVLSFPALIIAVSMPSYASIFAVGSAVVTYALSALFISGLLATIYHTYFVSKLGGTPGKLLMGMKIVDYNVDQNIDAKRAFFRTIAGYSFSVQLFGLGFLRIIKHPEKLGWHDELFATKVVKTKGPWLGVIALILCNILFSIVVITTVKNISNKADNKFSKPKIETKSKPLIETNLPPTL